MKLFKKKWDEQKDLLMMEFILERKQYAFFYRGFDEIPYEELSRRSKKKLDVENQKLIADNDLLNKEISSRKKEKRFEFLASKGYGNVGFEYLGPVNGTMGDNMEKFLNHLTSKENVLLGIHRIRRGTDIEDILNNGLNMTSHMGSGVFPLERNLGDNVGYYLDNKTIIKELMYADQYKSSIGSILIEIPDADLDKDIYVIDESGLQRLNPKYIIGFIPIEPNHHISKLITKEYFKKNTIEEQKKILQRELAYYKQLQEANNTINSKHNKR